MNKTALLIGGLGLGAGLIYMLDSERGERRRAMARAQLERYRRQTDDLWAHHAKLWAVRRMPLSQGTPGTQVQEAGTERAAVSPCGAARNLKGHADVGLYGARRRYDVYARSQVG